MRSFLNPPFLQDETHPANSVLDNRETSNTGMFLISLPKLLLPTSQGNFTNSASIPRRLHTYSAAHSRAFSAASHVLPTSQPASPHSSALIQGEHKVRARPWRIPKFSLPDGIPQGKELHATDPFISGSFRPWDNHG